MNYEVYKFRKIEYIKYGIIYCVVALFISYVFYDSIYVFVLLMPGSYLFFKYMKGILIKKRKSNIKMQFQNLIESVAAALSAGYSIEGAFYEAKRDMLRLYGAESYISIELEYFFSKIDCGNSIEAVLADFSSRVNIEDISDFTDIFVIAKRNGGGFNKIIKRVVRIMKEKEETDREIEVLLSGKRYEQRIMSLIPFMIVLYLRISSKSYLDILYHNILGICIMTVCLLIYLGSICISHNLINIHV